MFANLDAAAVAAYVVQLTAGVGTLVLLYLAGAGMTIPLRIAKIGLAKIRRWASLKH